MFCSPWPVSHHQQRLIDSGRWDTGQGASWLRPQLYRKTPTGRNSGNCKCTALQFHYQYPLILPFDRKIHVNHFVNTTGKNLCFYTLPPACLFVVTEMQNVCFGAEMTYHHWKHQPMYPRSFVIYPLTTAICQTKPQWFYLSSYPELFLFDYKSVKIQ